MTDASDLQAGLLSRLRVARRIRLGHAGALAVLGFAAVATLGVLLRPALPIDETRYLAVAWEMWTRGDWLVPTKNFALYAHKPPLLFWTMNLVWSLTGLSEIAARLVGPGFALLCLLLTGRLARRLWPERPEIGGAATLALAGMTAFALSGGLTMFDAALAAATVGGMLALWRAVHAGRPRDWMLLGLALALGGLAKGPVILIHLGSALALSPLWSAGRITWRAMARGAGIALGTGLALVALWVVPAAVTGGAEYREAILWTQSAGRVTEAFAHARPWWFLLALLPVLLFPWIAVPALWRAGARADWRDPGLRLCLVWGGAALLLFSLISGKQAHYLIPELPAAALLVARLSPERFPLRVPALLLAAAALAGIVVAAGLVPLGRAEALLQSLEQRLQVGHQGTGLHGGEDDAVLHRAIEGQAQVVVDLLLTHALRAQQRQRLLFGHLAQHLVARVMAERVVDALEAVEVDQHHGDPRETGLLGWYAYKRQQFREALDWFKLAISRGMKGEPTIDELIANRKTVKHYALEDVIEY